MIDAVSGKKKILLVDDDEIHLTTAELFLKNEYEIHKAKSGNEALEYLAGNKFAPDLIMLDIIMPNMDGWETFNRIRATDFLKNVPVVFLTAAIEEAEKKRAFKMGIADYITKPYNMTDLKSRVNDVIKKTETKTARK
ncbi:MAG: response regulator [Treponema sp.]|jgi:putative two-component system response regulator|nr:response regulator [Treponema sp.]